MPLAAPPINFDAVRVALVAAVRDCTGFDGNHVLMAEAEQPDQPRPGLPYATVKVGTPSAPKGFSDSSIDPVTNVYRARAQRSLVATINTYGPTHEGAYNAAGAIQAGFDMMPIQDGLRAAGLAVWSLGPILDVSELLDTGYEGRAVVDITLGVASNATYTTPVDYIDNASVQVNNNNADPTSVTVILGGS